MDNNKKALKSGVWYTVSNFLLKGMSLITTPIFTRLLTKKNYGLYNNFISWLSISTIIVTLCSEATLIRAKYDYSNKLNHYIKSMLAMTLLSASVWLLLINIFNEVFTDLFSMNVVYIDIMIVYIVFQHGVNFWQLRERFAFRYKMSTVISLATTIATTVISLILVVMMEDELAGRIIGNVSVTILIGFILYVYFFTDSKGIDCKSWPYALKASLPYMPHVLALTVLSSTDRIMITRLCSSVYTALYSLSCNVGNIISLLATSINTAYGPWLGERLHNKEYQEIRKFSYVYMLLPVYIGLGVMLISPEILLIMGGWSYLDAKYVMPPVTAGCILQFIYTMYVNVEQFERKTVGMAIGSVLAALMNYTLNLIFIPIYGYQVAAYTTLAGYAFLLFVHIYLVHRMGMGKIYDIRLTLLVAVSIIGITIGVNFLYQNDLLRFIGVAIYALVTFILVYRCRDYCWKIIRAIVK